MAKSKKPTRTWKRGPLKNGSFGEGVTLKKPKEFKLVNYRMPLDIVDDLRAISEATGETQRHHTELAIRRYLRKRKREGVFAS